MEWNPWGFANGKCPHVLEVRRGDKMQTAQISPEQKVIEERFEGIKNIAVDPEKTAVAQFGSMESWIFQLGEYRLFLNPLTKTWYYFDRIHNDLKDLKHPAGSGFFYLNGDNLEFSQYGATPAASSEVKCQKCGNFLNPNLKFCNQCGAAVPAAPTPFAQPVLHFCPDCGAQINQGAKFCNSCGKKLV